MYTFFHTQSRNIRMRIFFSSLYNFSYINPCRTFAIAFSASFTCMLIGNLCRRSYCYKTNRIRKYLSICNLMCRHYSAPGKARYISIHTEYLCRFLLDISSLLCIDNLCFSRIQIGGRNISAILISTGKNIANLKHRLYIQH